MGCYFAEPGAGLPELWRRLLELLRAAAPGRWRFECGADGGARHQGLARLTIPDGRPYVPSVPELFVD